MKVLRIIFHAIFFLLGAVLLIELQISNQLKDLLVFGLFAYSLFLLFLSVIKELLTFSFPRHILILFVFVFFAYLFFTKNFDRFSYQEILVFIYTSSTIIAFYFLGIAIIGLPIGYKLKKLKTNAFSKFYKANLLIFFSGVLLMTVLYYFFFENKYDVWVYSTTVLVAFLPHFNRNFIREFIRVTPKFPEQFSINISLSQFGEMARIKNFVFAKEKLIGTSDYHIINSDIRSTVKVTSVIRLALQLSNDWNKKYSKLFVIDEFEKVEIKYDIVERNENGICVIDDNAIMYHFGNYAFVKEKIRREDHANLFLLKNDLPIAKYTVNERIENSKAELVNQLDYFGNTILFNPGNHEDIGRDYSVVFDKVYSNVTSSKQNELLLELEKKAPTAFITAQKSDEINNSLCFYVTTNTDVKENESQIKCSSAGLMAIPKLIDKAKKVHTFFKYTLLSLSLTQLFLLAFAVFNLNKLTLILGINFGIVLIIEIISLIFAKKLTYFPDQPANLAQSHQAA